VVDWKAYMNCHFGGMTLGGNWHSGSKALTNRMTIWVYVVRDAREQEKRVGKMMCLYFMKCREGWLPRRVSASLPISLIVHNFQ